MRKYFISLLIVILLLLMLVFDAGARRCPPRNKHCRPATTSTVTMTITPARGAAPTMGTPVYTCMALTCATPGGK